MLAMSQRCYRRNVNADLLEAFTILMLVELEVALEIGLPESMSNDLTIYGLLSAVKNIYGIMRSKEGTMTGVYPLSQPRW